MQQKAATNRAEAFTKRNIALRVRIKNTPALILFIEIPAPPSCTAIRAGVAHSSLRSALHYRMIADIQQNIPLTV